MANGYILNTSGNAKKFAHNNNQYIFVLCHLSVLYIAEVEGSASGVLSSLVIIYMFDFKECYASVRCNVVTFICSMSSHRYCMVAVTEMLPQQGLGL